jgi:hypothetical protein
MPTIKLRNGSGVPTNGTLAVGEPAIDLTNKKLYTSTNGTDVVEVSTAYTHPSHPGDDFSVDTGALTGATVVSDIDINVTTDTLGHVTDANGSVATRTLTLANLGYTGATNATANTGTVTSVAGANGISGTVTTSGSLTLDNDLRSHAWIIGRDTNDYFIVNTTTQSWFLDGAEDMRLSNTGQLDVEGNVVAYSTTVSDERLKDNVETIANPLDTVSALRGVTFEWNKGHRQGQKDIGVIAQEVQRVKPKTP